jgi:hypothetical protein
MALLCGLASAAPVLVEAEAEPNTPELVSTAGLETMLATVERAIGEGDAKGVAKHFGAQVELSCGGGEGSYSRKQSEFVLRSFFRAHPPESYTTMSRHGDDRIVGSYVSTDGRVYSVDVRLTQAGNRSVVGYLHFQAG